MTNDHYMTEADAETLVMGWELGIPLPFPRTKSDIAHAILLLEARDRRLADEHEEEIASCE